MSWPGSIVFHGLSLPVLLGMVRFITAVQCFLYLGFFWDSESCVWLRPGLPALCQVSGPFQFFREAVGMLGELRLLVTLVLGLVFGVAGIWTFVVL